MQSLITSYLLQNKECILPGIGAMHVQYIPAEIEATSEQILPPSEKIIFEKSSNSKPTGLIKYISNKKNISIEDAEKQLNLFCKEWKEKINAGEKLYLQPLGYLQKDEQGNILFEEEREIIFYKPVLIKNDLIKKEDDHISDEEPVALNDDYNETADRRSYWGIWALILAAIGLTVLFFQFYNNKFSPSSTGNQNKISVDSAGTTYSIPK